MTCQRCHQLTTTAEQAVYRTLCENCWVAGQTHPGTIRYRTQRGSLIPTIAAEDLNAISNNVMRRRYP